MRRAVLIVRLYIIIDTNERVGMMKAGNLTLRS